MILAKSSYGWYYRCELYPACDCTVGAHQHSGKPLGKPVDRTTRKERSAAHDVLDRLWKENIMSRMKAYQWLSREMNKLTGRSRHRWHIADMNFTECQQAIQLCKEKWEKLK